MIAFRSEFRPLSPDRPLDVLSALRTSAFYVPPAPASTDSPINLSVGLNSPVGKIPAPFASPHTDVTVSTFVISATEKQNTPQTSEGNKTQRNNCLEPQLSPQGKEIVRILLQNEWNDMREAVEPESAPPWRLWQYLLLLVWFAIWLAAVAAFLILGF